MKHNDNTEKKKLLYFVTEDWYFCSHRLDLAMAAINAGYSVTVVTQVGCHAELIKDSGIELIPLKLSRRSVNPIRELYLLIKLVRIFSQHSPDIVHNVAIKPVIYGSIAARLTGVSAVINALTGLGYVFISRKLIVRGVRLIVSLVYRLLLNRPNVITIIQNRDDSEYLINSKILKKERTALIRGSGVKLDQFVPGHITSAGATVILPGRMLRDKGVEEFVDAARYLKAKGVQARYVLVGDVDPDNPTSIARERILDWVAEGSIEWWGKRTDMVNVYHSASIVCLPSYREGLPKVLIEAAACAKPIISTDVPGCREVVENGVNGLLVPARDATALAGAMEILINDPALQQKMGTNGRKKAEEEFSLSHIIEQTLNVYEEQLS